MRIESRCVYPSIEKLYLFEQLQRENAPENIFHRNVSKLKFPFFSTQVWFKNRRAKVRQQQTHQQTSNSSSARPANRVVSTSRGGSVGGSSGTNNNNNSKSGMSTSSSKTATNASTTSSTSSMKHGQNVTTSSTTNNNNSLSHHNSNSNTGNNTAASNSNNGLNQMGHNSSPILPMTPTSSVSPPVNVICKKELNTNYHSINNGVQGLTDSMKPASIHDSIKEEMSGMITTNSHAYSNLNARLGHGGNSTPLGSNSSIITTPSPPMTPSQQALSSYVPNHEYFWNYNQYSNGYGNAPANYYPQVDYSNQSNYSIGHSGYSTANMGLSGGNTFNGTMAAQPFTSNGLDYMSQPDKYVNMV